MSTSDSPILVLDSGVGGLTVVHSLAAALPHEQILYFGDTARVPYGSKSASTVTSFVRQIIAWARPRDPKHVIIACNTATALALPTIREEFPELSISGVIEPGARAAVEAAGAKEWPSIGVIGTEATIKSRAYERAIHRRRTQSRLLLRPTPLLVPIIEDGRPGDDPLVELALEQYLRPLLDRGIDVLVLGCTHYPMLKDAIVRLVGPNIRVIDSADRCADDVARRLATTGVLRTTWGATTTTIAGTDAIAARSTLNLECYVTDDTTRFAAMAQRFLGMTIDAPIYVPTEELHACEAALPGPML